MRNEDIEEELKELAFDFFYWFSRFEFALKENKLLKHKSVGQKAEPCWESFIQKCANDFQHTDQSRKLLDLDPMAQKVGTNLELEWKHVSLEDCKSELCKVVRLLKTIRNNLFHGGKHVADGWDDPERTKELLTVGKGILDQLARVGGFEADYTQYY